MRLVRRIALVLWWLTVLACGAGGDGDDFDRELADLEGRVAEEDEVSAGNLVDVAGDDPELAAAEAEARATLDTFIADLASPPPGHEGHAIKAAFRDGPLTEHMWVGELRWDGERFHGQIANDPIDIHNVEIGQTVAVERAEVEDWLYTAGGQMVGGYTVRVLMARETR